MVHRISAQTSGMTPKPMKAGMYEPASPEEGDVRNVTVVLGLRPFTAKAEILPEQVIGRGLRLMMGVSPDRTQTLEVRRQS